MGPTGLVAGFPYFISIAGIRDLISIFRRSCWLLYTVWVTGKEEWSQEPREVVAWSKWGAAGDVHRVRVAVNQAGDRFWSFSIIYWHRVTLSNGCAMPATCVTLNFLLTTFEEPANSNILGLKVKEKNFQFTICLPKNISLWCSLHYLYISFTHQTTLFCSAAVNCDWHASWKLWYSF